MTSAAGFFFPDITLKLFPKFKNIKPFCSRIQDWPGSLLCDVSARNSKSQSTRSHTDLHHSRKCARYTQSKEVSSVINRRTWGDGRELARIWQCVYTEILSCHVCVTEQRRFYFNQSGSSNCSSIGSGFTCVTAHFYTKSLLSCILHV